MKYFFSIFITLVVALAGCTSSQVVPPSSTSTDVPTLAPITSTSRITMLPTWTSAPTLTPRPTRTPRPTATPQVTVLGSSLPTTSPAASGTEILLDRPTYSQLFKPENLVTLLYDPILWSLNTFYPTAYMGYSLTHRSIYDCKLEPSVGRGAEGFQVEKYARPLGKTTFEIARVSQAGELILANYCTGEGGDYTCYQVTPGDDHAACLQAAESVLSTYALIPNPFFSLSATSPNQWLCQSVAGENGLCQISYSVPLNALAFTDDGQSWAAGDDGLIYNRTDTTWSEISSPATHPIYDLSFSSSTDGWAVGAGAQVLHWDGDAWSEALPYHGPGEGPGGSTQDLFAVDTASAEDAWMVGAMKGIDGKIIPYALHWDGTDLVEQTTFPACNCGLNAVLILGKDDVIAVGGSDLGAIAFRWDGSIWTSSLIPGADHLYAISRAADGSLWSAGIETARDQSDTRGVLFRWDGSAWQRIAMPPLTGGIYSLLVPPSGQLILGGDFTLLRSGLSWQPILTGIAGYGWIADIELDYQGEIWALTHSGNLFRLAISP